MNLTQIKNKIFKKFNLKNLEFWIFKKLLKRYCDLELDQHSRWTFKSKYGNVFVSIDRQGDSYNYDKLDV